MHTIAAAPGWRNLAVQAMPPVAYTLASETRAAKVPAGAQAHPPPPRDGRLRIQGLRWAVAVAAIAVVIAGADCGVWVGLPRVPGESLLWRYDEIRCAAAQLLRI